MPQEEYMVEDLDPRRDARVAHREGEDRAVLLGARDPDQVDSGPQNKVGGARRRRPLSVEQNRAVKVCVHDMLALKRLKGRPLVQERRVVVAARI